jgi:hypothetical protein
MNFDKASEADLVMDHSDSMVNEGNAYFLSRPVTLPVANDDEIRLQTPDTTTWLRNFKMKFISDAAVTVSLYSATELTYVAGNILTPVNRDLNSSNTSARTNMCHTPAGAGSDGVLLWQDTEAANVALYLPVSLVLKQNTAYLIRVAGASGDVVKETFWWEEYKNIR